MATKLFKTRKQSYVYVVVRSANQKIKEQVFQSDEIISTHKTRQGAEQKLQEVKPTVPTRSFTRYQIRKFLLSK